MQLNAHGRHVLVTGGSQGLGLATARAYAQAGAKVTIVARGQAPLERARAELAAAGSGDVLALAGDVTSADDLLRTHAAAVAAHGPVDVLVNNAGRKQAQAFETISDALWQEDLDLKQFAAIRMTRLVWPDMKARRWGRVINVLNTFAKAPGAGTAPTSVSRAAGLALTKVLAAEGAPHNILVNALLVGLVDTDQMRGSHAAMASDQPYERFVAALGAQVPLGRVQPPPPVAPSTRAVQPRHHHTPSR